MVAVYEHRLVVETSDIDGVGHVNNLAFLRWALDAALGHSTVLGWSPEKYLASGFGWFVRAHQIRYHRPAFEDDKVVVKTWVANFKGFRSLRRFEIYREPGQELLARGSTDWVFVDLGSGMPRPIAPEVAKAYTIVPDPK